MQPTHVLMIAATILTLSSTSAFSDTTITFDPLADAGMSSGRWEHSLHEQGSARLHTDDPQATVGRALAG